MQMSFSAAIARSPLRLFQILVVVFGLMMLMVEGIDMQSLSLVTPLILKEWGIDRALFGPALAGALFGMAFGSSLGGMLGDRFGRLTMLFAATLFFGLTTVAAAFTHDVTAMTAIRVIGGLGFGTAYPNAMALANDWVPERWRTYVVTLLSVGTPVGSTVSAAIVPLLLPGHGWRGTFIIFGVFSILLGALTIAVVREAPGYLLAKGRKEAAQRSAARVIDPAIDLLPEPQGDDQDGADGPRIGVFHPANTRLNWGISISFTACTAIVYGLSSWAPTFLTASGFTLDQALRASVVLGVVSVIGGVSAGYFARTFGSRTVTIACSALSFLSIVALGWMIQTMGARPTLVERQVVDLLIGLVGGVVSVGMATCYAVMAAGYPQSCRSGGIGFGMTMGRFGGIAMVYSGGWLLNLAGDSFIFYFAALALTSLAIVAAAFIVDRHIEPALLTPIPQ